VSADHTEIWLLKLNFPLRHFLGASKVGFALSGRSSKELPLFEGNFFKIYLSKQHLALRQY